MFATVVMTCCLAVGQTAPKQDSTLGQKPPEGAVVLFDGKSLDAWRSQKGPDAPAPWTVAESAFTVKPRSGSILTRDEYPGDFRLHVEFRTPDMPDAKGQAKGNSGVYLQGRYEIQVLDSYGLDSKDNDCGGIYQQHKPLVNACKKPTEWQTYDIDFKAPKLQDGKQTEPAVVTIYQNGQLIHDKAPINPTPGGISHDPSAKGPILLQDHGNLVSFRNIWLLPTTR
jgi:hypothetical protein